MTARKIRRWHVLLQTRSERQKKSNPEVLYKTFPFAVVSDTFVLVVTLGCNSWVQ